MADYNAYMKMGLLELREIGKEVGVVSPTTYPKRELVIAILEKQGETVDMDQLPPPPPRRGGRPKTRLDKAVPRRGMIGRPKKTDILSETPAETEPADGKAINHDGQEISPEIAEFLKSGRGIPCTGVLDIADDGYGFLRKGNFDPKPDDIYVSQTQIRRFSLKNGDEIEGLCRPLQEKERNSALMYIQKVNGEEPEKTTERVSFEQLVPVFPDQRYRMECEGEKDDLAIRVIDLIAPIGKGQRGLIVSPPKAGKTTLLKKMAHSISKNYPNVYLMVLLIDERPEEVTDMQESIDGEVIYSTFDQLPEHHTHVAEVAFDRAARLCEQKKDVVILLDSITRLSRAYNLVIPPTGRTLSGGLDPGALFKPKRFFGSARNIRNGGSLTIIATALVDTGSRMDDIVYEEFKGTGNMEIQLDRKLSEKRIFPAIDLYKSGTRRDDLLLSKQELECASDIRRMLSSSNTTDATDQLLSLMAKTSTNEEFLVKMKNWTKLFESQGYSFSN